MMESFIGTVALPTALILFGVLIGFFLGVMLISNIAERHNFVLLKQKALDSETIADLQRKVQELSMEREIGA